MTKTITLLTRGLYAVALGTLIARPANGSNVIQRWDFAKNSDREGWTIPGRMTGVVMGGALWVQITPKETDPAIISKPRYQVLGDGQGNMVDFGIEILSPRGLGITSREGTPLRLKMKILNLSPATDFFLRWRAKEQTQGWGERGEKPWAQFLQSRHGALKSDLKEWQEITCSIDPRWKGLIDQIEIYIPQTIRGDIWISSIELDHGLPEPVLSRPDVASSAVVPRVAIPGISQAGFAQAFKVLDECLVTDVPVLGFTHPFMSPGGYYSVGGWWPLDSSLTVSGAKWVNQGFAEGVMRGFHDVQAENPDGRIDLWGNSAVRGDVGDVSQLPRIFEVAYDVARRTNDRPLRGEIYQMMQRYLDWWLSPVKRDSRTGLISGVAEETFGESDQFAMVPQSIAPVDLNVAVTVGAARTADLAAALGQEEDSRKYRQVFRDLSRAINGLLWDEHDGVYYNYDLRERRARKRLIVTTFDPLRLGIAPAARRDRLLKRMIDPAQFNWGKVPLTSLAMTDPSYMEAKGHYDGRAWFGDVWTELNLPIIAGLEESGRSDLAAELNWATIKAFHLNYREYLIPSTGEGQGAEGYGWTASQYITAIVEHLFGVDFDRMRKQVRITPHIPTELYGKDLALDGLILPTGRNTRLSIRINQSSEGTAQLAVNISGQLPQESLRITVPGSAKVISIPARHSVEAAFSSE